MDMWDNVPAGSVVLLLLQQCLRGAHFLIELL